MCYATRKFFHCPQHALVRHHNVLRMIQVREALPHHTAFTLPLRRIRFGTNSVIRKNVHENTLLESGLFRFIGYKARTRQHDLSK